MEITPRHIEQIEALRRYGSFSRAAEKLCISQPALSRSILLLEEKLGVRFFDRARGKLVLTPYGDIVLSRGEGILRELRLLRRDIDMLQGGGQGVLTIGCGPITAETLAGRAISRFNSVYPKMSVRLIIDQTQQLTKLLQKRSIDFFVAETYQVEGDPEYELTAMPQQQGYFCCRKGHPLTTIPALQFKDILDYPLASMWLSDRIFTLFSELSGTTLQTYEDLGAGFIKCNNTNVLMCIVSNSDAVSMTTHEMLTESVYKDAIFLLPLHVPALRSAYSIVSIRGVSTLPAISRLKELFLETAMEQVRRGEEPTG